MFLILGQYDVSIAVQYITLETVTGACLRLLAIVSDSGGALQHAHQTIGHVYQLKTASNIRIHSVQYRMSNSFILDKGFLIKGETS